MHITMFDVGHGACTVVNHPQIGSMMFDCGRRDAPPWLPSEAFAGQMIDHLVLTNLDEDHVSDLPNLLRTTTVRYLYNNPTIDARALAQLKAGSGAGPGIDRVQQLLVNNEIMSGWAGPVLGPDRPPITGYFNYFGVECNDTNNLSLATFLRYGTFVMLFTGDLEAAGWRQLLMKQGFRNDLGSVKVLVASHHGRQSGICDEALELCRPEVVLISDGPKSFDSQNTDDWYRARTRGTCSHSSARTPGQRPGGARHVFTTRRDSSIHIGVDVNGQYHITTDLVYITPGAGQ